MAVTLAGVGTGILGDGMPVPWTCMAWLACEAMVGAVVEVAGPRVQ